MPKLLPSRTKYRKVQKGRLRGKAQRGAKLAFGTYGIQALRAGYMTSSQIESARVAITRHLKRKGNLRSAKLIASRATVLVQPATSKRM